MTFRTVGVGWVVAALLAGATGAHAQVAPRSQLDSHVLPAAAGALVGGAVAFFIMPLIFPATAVTVGIGATTASPVIALIGAGFGGIIGYGLSQ